MVINKEKLEKIGAFTTFEEFWNDYLSNINLGDHDTKLLKECIKHTFYSGGVALLALTDNIADTAIDDDDYENRLGAAVDELTAFVAINPSAPNPGQLN